MLQPNLRADITKRDNDIPILLPSHH